MDIVTILKIVSIILGVLTSTLIPTGIALYKTWKAKQNAKTVAEKAAAMTDMLTQLNVLIEAAETTYKDINAVMKERGLSMGAVKKDSVLSKLQAYAIENGYEYDADFWSGKTDEIVKMTRTVNGK